ANCQNRQVDANVDLLVELAARRGRLLQEIEDLRKRRNENSQATNREKEPARKDELIAEGRGLKDKIAALEAELVEVEGRLRIEQLKIPNMTHPAAPVGAGEEANREVRRWGEPTKFSFRPLDHVDLGLQLDLM